MRKSFLALLINCFTVVLACAQNISLPALWSNNAVLKQNSEVAIRGWADPTAQINIVASWAPNDTVRVITANSGKFLARIQTPAGSYTPHTLYFNGQPLMSNVLVGEVWVCSGQSNMQWSVNHGVMDGEKHAAEANSDYIRIFNIPLCTAETPQEDLRAQWTTVTPETMRRASAVGYFFARELQKTLAVPVGIVINAWGGASAEGYTPSERVYGNPEIAQNIASEPNGWRDDRPGKIYNAMVAPLQPYAISGVIWYQGETNVPKWGVYDKLIKELVEGWRQGFAQQMPFYMAQIAPFNYGGDKEAAPLRIMQERASREIPKSAMIVVSDLTDNVNDIHPKDKLSVGKRFAALALADTYGLQGQLYKYPLFKSAYVTKSGKVIVEFDNLVGNLTLAPGAKEVEGLTITDNQGKVYNARGKINGTKLEVSAPGVREPKGVRYCYDNTTLGNLRSEEGLPVAPFNSLMKK